MSTATRYIQASIEHLKYAQNGGALRARFRDGFHGEWEDGWLVGWTQGKRQWMMAWESPDELDFYGDWINGEAPDVSFWQYCEILESDLHGV
jgi:hypothetical protein